MVFYPVNDVHRLGLRCSFGAVERLGVKGTDNIPAGETDETLVDTGLVFPVVLDV